MEVDGSGNCPVGASSETMGEVTVQLVAEEGLWMR